MCRFTMCECMGGGGGGGAKKERERGGGGIIVVSSNFNFCSSLLLFDRESICSWTRFSNETLFTGTLCVVLLCLSYV